MHSLDLLQHNGFGLLLGSIVAGQAGVPMPSATLLMLAAAFSHELRLQPLHLVLLVTGAVVLTDHLWFWLGRSQGVRLLAWLERQSPAASAAVGAVRRLNRRHGALLLLVAKFLPGVHALVVPASAALHLGYARFVLFDTLGTLVWVSVYVALGLALGPLVQDLVALLQPVVQWLGVGLASVAAVWALRKLTLRWIGVRADTVPA